MVKVRLLGVPAIEGPDGSLREVRGHKPWAVLARLLLSDRPLRRQQLAAELFPDTVDPLGSLRWCLAALRKAIGSSQVFTGDPISVTLPAGVRVDVLELMAGRIDTTDVGDLLDGVPVASGPEFSTWLLVTREHVAARTDGLLREATITALSREQYDVAVRLAERAAGRTPLDEGAQVMLVKSLALAGRARAAASHVLRVEQLFRTELGCDPSPALRSAARPSVAAPPPGIPAATLAGSLLEAGRAALAAGAVEAGLDCLRRAGGHAEATGDPRLLGQTFFELGTALIHAVRGFDDEGCILLGQAVEQAIIAGDQRTAVRALQEHGYADALAGRRPQAAEHLGEARRLAGSQPELLAGVEAVTAFNLADWGRLTEALPGYETALDLARRVADRRREAWILTLSGWACLREGDVAGAVSRLSQGLSVVRELRWVSFEPMPLAALAEAAVTSVDRAELERCFALSCQLGDPCWEAASGRVLALHHAHRGDAGQAVRWITDARVRGMRRSDTWVGMLATILITEAELRAVAGDAAGAAASAREAVVLSARAHLDQLLARSTALLGGIA
ncbi:hypothetical protein Aph02nite_31930 [Actinoplanes philippinensis]|uniref:DNA-binding transcriptional activator of the SARP family n=1 Tax=Actinoplanes philippinensis TaxID=35752 RepID=A0A1I2E6K8_9ACTN|nr:BTAD domain-containing putative transcriptional regulator [Actinoplanes philippinensis]GIE77243.1 hypothetical protein Aph02nite_31930 [Actinoplanes philippinensis]SFE88266.1 DNA-binding transcriptional activator of the SARP family [Actinoplanes philippinensis]